MSDFEVKDSGARLEFESGMKRDGEAGKLNYLLALDGPMHERYVVHMNKGALKYGEGNWLNANSREEWARFRRSAYRHLLQWLDGERDEDHAAAVMFNLNAAEYVLDRLSTEPSSEPEMRTYVATGIDESTWR